MPGSKKPVRHSALVNELLGCLEEVDDDRRYTDFRPDDYIRMTDDAVLASCQGREIWLPLKHLRQLDGEVYIAIWLARREGLD